MKLIKYVCTECGPHGRFEYCIDGIPGCIVGCHCHPGYYFDTETKVCEPNTKLRMDYRRQFQSEPTPTFVTATDPSPTPTTTASLIDRNVEAIAKDADDLGDWLYNQFFKTIENQVINKTDEEKQPTRRSGSNAEAGISQRKLGITGKPTRRSNTPQRRNRHKHSKRSSKKKHSRKSLKKKLLRISEDDSLFDSSSDDSSSSSSSSASSDSDSSSEERSKDHGRKILMINKKPTVPLPSFIFMPNMETPYFPPLGLPAPPPAPMPMYPMIPIPPVMPYPMISMSSSTSGTEAPHTTDAPHTTNPPHNTETPNKTESPEPEENKPDEEKPEEAAPEVRRGYGRKSGKGIFRNRGNQRPNAKQRFMKMLQEKMKKKYEMSQRNNYFPQDFKDPEFEHGLSEFEPNMPLEYEQNGNSEFTYSDTHPDPELGPYNHNVNFKYLSQLIHKMNKTDFNPTLQPQSIKLPRQNPSQTPNLILIPNNNRSPNQIPNLDPNRNSDPYSHIDMASLNVVNGPNRRLGNTAMRIVNNTAKDDYADLGRQIAALVRKIESKGDQQVDISFEGEKSEAKIPPVMFNDNGMSSRSYWERFARSPFKIRLDTDFRHLHSSEELQQIQLNLEDRINKEATTPRSLSLQQIENRISVIQRIKSAQDKEDRKPKYRKPTKLRILTPLNILPKIKNKVTYHPNLVQQNKTKSLYVATTQAKKPLPIKLNLTMPYHSEHIPKGLMKVSGTHNKVNKYAQRFKIPLSSPNDCMVPIEVALSAEGCMHDAGECKLADCLPSTNEPGRKRCDFKFGRLF
ncbi:uncharacterized protein LOC132902749 [Amyelois transitella]|uniref:uncharacterized protein LOC132902749 n=1 Tax=Amyelois transitella TaxID=680683 RepID=UPI00298FE08C|nr:uncharacterized protein LOC132902749 [Amyelois transitella]